MLSIGEMESLVDQCKYKPGWYIHFRLDLAHHGRPYIQIACTEGIDSTTGERVPWCSGKRYLSRYMCRQEVVGAVFSLIKDAEMHELHEWFRYKGASIFNPHIDPDVLVEVASKAENFNMRENAMTMQE